MAKKAVKKTFTLETEVLRSITFKDGADDVSVIFQPYAIGLYGVVNVNGRMVTQGSYQYAQMDKIEKHWAKVVKEFPEAVVTRRPLGDFLKEDDLTYVNS
jgi:hypothetical protein